MTNFVEQYRFFLVAWLVAIWHVSFLRDMTDYHVIFCGITKVYVCVALRFAWSMWDITDWYSTWLFFTWHDGFPRDFMWYNTRVCVYVCHNVLPDRYGTWLIDIVHDLFIRDMMDSHVTLCGITHVHVCMSLHFVWSMWDMTHWYSTWLVLVCLVWFILCVTWLSLFDMGMCLRLVLPCWCGTWLILLCDMGHDSFYCIPWLILSDTWLTCMVCVCIMFCLIDMGHDSFCCVSWLILSDTWRACVVCVRIMVCLVNMGHDSLCLITHSVCDKTRI